MNAPALPAGFEPEAHHVATVVTAAQALLDAFGGDTPDWLTREASTLQSALGSYWAQRERVTATPPAPAADPLRIVINATGGVVQGVLANAADVGVLVLDYHTAEARDDVMAVPSFDRSSVSRAVVVEIGADIERAWVDRLFDRVRQRDAGTVLKRADYVAAATAAGWLVETDNDDQEDEEAVDVAWAPEGTYAFGDWQADLMPPLGSVYQWRVNAIDQPGPARLFVCTSDVPMADGVQYRVATLSAAAQEG